MNTTVRSHLTALVGLGAGAVALIVAGGTLPPPPADPLRWPEWWVATDPALAVGALLRVVALVMAVYLCAVTMLDLLGTISGATPLRRVAHRLAPAAWRQLVLRPLAAGTLAVPGLIAPVISSAPAGADAATVVVPEAPGAPAGPSSAANTPAGAAAPDEGVVFTMTWQGSPTVAATTPTAVPGADQTGEDDAPAADDAAEADDAAPPDDDDTPTDTTPADVVLPTGSTAPAQTAPPTDTDPSASASAETRTRTVVAGDSLWSIANDRLAGDLGRAPDAHEVAAYWAAVIDHNRDRLPVPDDPDLIFPGNVVELPPSAPAG